MIMALLLTICQGHAGTQVLPRLIEGRLVGIAGKRQSDRQQNISKRK